METITLETGVDTITSPEILTKEEIFGTTLRSILFETDLELQSVSSFASGQREHPIDSSAAAVMALGQIPARASQKLYDKITSRA